MLRHVAQFCLLRQRGVALLLGVYSHLLLGGTGLPRGVHKQLRFERQLHGEG